MDFGDISFLDIKQFLMFNGMEVHDDKDITYTLALDIIENGDYEYIPDSILKYIEQRTELSKNDQNKEHFKENNNKISIRDIDFDEIELFLSANDMTIPNDLDLAYKLTADMIKKNKYSFIQDALLSWQNMLVLGTYDENTKDIINVNYLTNLRDELLYVILEYLDPRSIILFCETGKTSLKHCTKSSFRKLLTDKIGNCDKLSNNKLFFYAKSYVLNKQIFSSYSDGLNIITKDYIYKSFGGIWNIIKNDNNIKQYFLSFNKNSTMTLLTNNGDILERNKYDNELSKYTEINNICNLFNVYDHQNVRHFHALDYSGNNYEWDFKKSEFFHRNEKNIIQQNKYFKLDINGELFYHNNGKKAKINNVIQISNYYALIGNGDVYDLKNCGINKIDKLSNIKRIDSCGDKLAVLTNTGTVFIYKDSKQLFEKYYVIEIQFGVDGLLYALTNDNKILWTAYNDDGMFDLNTLTI